MASSELVRFTWVLTVSVRWARMLQINTGRRFVEKGIPSLDVNFSQPLIHLLLIHPTLRVSLDDDAGRKLFFSFFLLKVTMGGSFWPLAWHVTPHLREHKKMH